MAALVFLVDAVAGVNNDTDMDMWAFTSELSVRAPLAPPPPAIDARATNLRQGTRSATVEVPLVVDGEVWGTSFSGFAKVPRRDGDPPKITLQSALRGRPLSIEPLDVPLRDAAGFESRDPSAGVVEVALSASLLNPAGALQGAIAAGLAEAAAEDLADHHRAVGFGRHVVTEMELRYLHQNRTPTIATRAWFVGPPEAGLVRVDLVEDGGRGRVTTAIMARVGAAPL